MRSSNCWCRGKTVSISWSECVFDSLLSSMQCACAVLYRRLACPALQYFPTLSHKRYDFRKKVAEHKMCVLIFCTTFTWNIFHSKKKWTRYEQKCAWSSCKVVVILVGILMNFEFSGQIFEKYSRYQVSWKSVQWEPSSLHADRRTDRHDEANSRFSQFFELA